MKDKLIFKKEHIVPGVYCGFAGVFLSGISAFIYALSEQRFEPYDDTSKLATAIMILIGMLIMPFIEEVIFRGKLMPWLEKMSKNRIFAIIVSSIIFGSLHMNLLQSTMTFLFGVILALLYYYSRSLVPSIIAHYVLNCSSTLINLVKNICSIESMTYDAVLLLIILIGLILFSFKTLKTHPNILRSLNEKNFSDEEMTTIK